MDGWFDRDELDLGSDPADPGSFPGAGPAPAPPARLTALPLRAADVYLRWRDRSPDESAWRIERRTAGAGGFETVALLPPDATAWLDRDLVPGSYDYRVFALNASGTRGFAGVNGVATCLAPASPATPEPVPAPPSAGPRAGARTGH